MTARLGVIGCGAMAETLLASLMTRLVEPLEQLSLLVPPGSQDRAAKVLERFGPQLARTRAIHTKTEEMTGDRLELVAECAGHAAVLAHIPAILKAGCDAIIISAGALANDDLRDRLRQAAIEGRSALIIPAGAVGGLDLLAAAALAGLESVRYTGRKPPQAWRGTEAERIVDLDAVETKTSFFTGTARQAAQTYPQNANVAAAIALAGNGFDLTQVELVADPTITCNVHELSVRSACVNFTLSLQGLSSLSNPKTSLTAGYSVAQTIMNHLGPLSIG